VDGLVNLIGYMTQLLSAVLRLFQSGSVQHYLLIAFLSVLCLMVFQLR
jgi:hypothetical protein